MTPSPAREAQEMIRQTSAPRSLVLIPAYNEAARIGTVIAGIRHIVPDLPVLVVNDGSRDDTARAAGEAGAIVVSHPFNMGYGAAIQTGYKYARKMEYDFLVQLDADGQHDPECIPSLLAPVIAGEADIAIGSRFLGNSYRPPLARRAGMALFRTIVSTIVGKNVTDTTSGFQAFNRPVIRFFCSDVFPVDYPDADMLIMLHRVGFRMTEVPVRMYENSEGKSMHSGLKPLYYMFKMLLSIGVTLMRERTRERR